MCKQIARPYNARKHHLAFMPLLLQTKEEIANSVKSELCKVMQAFGYEILQALVTDIEPAPKVKDAMNEINAARAMK
jgi:regulator of protease activity HflC (stomatin/prohibitin superfamily)